MTGNPDQIREQIEETRTSLSEDVNTLADTVNPAHAAKRRAASARSAVLGVKDKMMGTASQSVSSTTSTARDTASAVHDKVASGEHTMSSAAGRMSETPAQIRRQTAGNPLAVGLIAVGVGWLVGSLLPASSAEQRAAAKVEGHRGASRHRRGPGCRGQPEGLSPAGRRVGQGHRGRRRCDRQGRVGQRGA